MIITKEILEANGFTSNHPDYMLCKYNIGSGTDWHITIEQKYYSSSNKLGWDVSMWNQCGTTTIQKRIQAGLLETIEDLNSLIRVCEIPNLIYVEK